MSDVPPPHRRVLPHFAISEQGLRELELWLSQFFALKSAVVSALSGLFYNKDNEGGWFYGAANSDEGPNGYSWEFNTGSSDRPVAITGDGGFTVDTDGQTNIGGSPVTIGDTGATVVVDPGGDVTIELADVAAGTRHFLVKDSAGDTLIDAPDAGDIALGRELSMGSHKIVNVADPTNDQDAATKKYVDDNTGGGGGIEFATANSGTYLDIETTAEDGVNIQDTAVLSNGILIQSQNGNVLLEADQAAVELQSQGTALTVSGSNLSNSIAAGLEDGGTFVINDHLGSPLVTYTG